MSKFRKVPFLPGYFVSPEGTIKNAKGGKSLPVFIKEGLPFVEVAVGKKRFSVEVARVVLNTFRPLSVPSKVMHLFKVDYLSPTDKSTALMNLRWVGPKDPIPCDFLLGFFYIPGFTRYAMNNDGLILDLFTRAFINTRKSDDSYIRAPVIEDGDKETRDRLVHRLKMMTFRPIFFGGKRYVVNHLNGIKDSNGLDNLEWTDYSGNILHAYNTGLRNDNRPVKLYDILTGKEELFYSMAECARRFNKKTERVWDYLHKQPGKIRFDHYLVKWVDDHSEWEPFTKDDCFIPSNGKAIPMLLKNVATGTVTQVASAMEAAEVTGVKMGTIRYYVTNKIPRAKNGWLFKDAHDKTPWLEVALSEGEKFVIHPRRKITFTIQEIRSNEVVATVNSSIEAASFFGISDRTMYYHMRNSSDGLTCKGYKVIKNLVGPRRRKKSPSI